MRLYHNPRCSKSRKALELLEKRGVEFETYLYMKDGVAKEDMAILVTLEGIVRKKDLDKSVKIDLSNNEAVSELLESMPKLLERPILIRNGNAVIGRPPEAILSILD